ncbi:2136_t:CDS:1, partial [Racocetra fulgida]
LFDEPEPWKPYDPSNDPYEDFKKDYAVAVFNLRTSIMALKQDLMVQNSLIFQNAISDIANSTNNVEEITIKFILDSKKPYPLDYTKPTSIPQNPQQTYPSPTTSPYEHPKHHRQHADPNRAPTPT